MNADTVITALFNPDTCALIVDVSGFGSVSRAPDQSSYELGTTVQLTAIPGAGWEFTGWTGDVTTVMNPMTLVVGGVHSVLAQFELAAAAMTSSLHVSIVGEGSVGRSPDRERFGPNETVELRATPATGWKFAEWQGDLSGTSMTAPLPMATSREVVAVFQRLPEEKKWSVVLDSGAHGTIIPGGTQTVSDGTILRVRIEPDAGYMVDRLFIDGIPLSLPTTAAQIYELGPPADAVLQCSFAAVQLFGRPAWFASNRIDVVDGRRATDWYGWLPVIQNNRSILPSSDRRGLRRNDRVAPGASGRHAVFNRISVSLQIANRRDTSMAFRRRLMFRREVVTVIISAGRTSTRFVPNLGLQVDGIKLRALRRCKLARTRCI